MTPSPREMRSQVRSPWYRDRAVLTIGVVLGLLVAISAVALALQPAPKHPMSTSRTLPPNVTGPGSTSSTTARPITRSTGSQLNPSTSDSPLTKVGATGSQNSGNSGRGGVAETQTGSTTPSGSPTDTTPSPPTTTWPPLTTVPFVPPPYATEIGVGGTTGLNQAYCGVSGPLGGTESVCEPSCTFDGGALQRQAGIDLGVASREIFTQDMQPSDKSGPSGTVTVIWYANRNTSMGNQPGPELCSTTATLTPMSWIYGFSLRSQFLGFECPDAAGLDWYALTYTPDGGGIFEPSTVSSTEMQDTPSP